MIDWIAVLDLFGVFVFALSGGFDGARYKLDIFGIMVLAVATGVGGGIMRDALLGVHPPLVFENQSYLLTCFGGGLVAVFFSHRVERQIYWVKLADALGLGVFAAIGAAKASAAGLGWVGVLMISVISAAGGGVIRDLLVREIPMILRSDFYASAALIGGGVYLIGDYFGLRDQPLLVLSLFSAVTARLLAIRFDLHLPQARGHS